MKYQCSACFENDPCILQFNQNNTNSIPTRCPIGLAKFTINWKEIKDSDNTSHNKAMEQLPTPLGYRCNECGESFKCDLAIIVQHHKCCQKHHS
jgi:hypothetical protein